MSTITKKLKPITVTTGNLAGMEFKPVMLSTTTPQLVVIVYRAPNEGPRGRVSHMLVKGKLDPIRMAEDVRIAFSPLLPASVLWSKENGYSERTSGNALKWSPQLGRFVLAEKPKEES